MKLILSLSLVLFTLTVFSQRPGKRKEATASAESTVATETNGKKPSSENNDSIKAGGHSESEAYSELRRKLTRPPDGIKKILAMIDKIKPDSEKNEAIKAEDYNALSMREKFTYNMIHAESYCRDCAIPSATKDEDKKIYAYLPGAYHEFAWSERQTKFFSGNRDSVIEFMKESMGRTKRAGVNFKQCMLEINAKEMIPDIIATFKANKKVKDLDLLTVLLNLMKDNEYEAFLVSGSYKKLYAEETHYKSYLNYSQSNVDLIIKRATDFYNADHNK